MTLARLRRAYDSAGGCAPSSSRARASAARRDLTLYRSEPGQGDEGATYVPLARFAFAAKTD